MRKKPAGKLTPYRQRFVEEYLKDLNGAAAVRRSGSKSKRPEQDAYELLTFPDVKAAVEAAKAKRRAESAISADRVLEEIRRLALVDPRGYFDARGNAQPLTELSAEQAAAIAGFEVVTKNATSGDGHTDTVLKFKLCNKIQALELLCKHLGLLQADIVPPGAAAPVYLLPDGARVATK